MKKERETSRHVTVPGRQKERTVTGPHMITVAAGAEMPWADMDAFATDFEAHFCAVDDRNAAIAEFNKLVK